MGFCMPLAVAIYSNLITILFTYVLCVRVYLQFDKIPDTDYIVYHFQLYKNNCEYYKSFGMSDKCN